LSDPRAGNSGARKRTIKNLLAMGEAAGLKQLDILVPRTRREGWDSEFVQTLSNIAYSGSDLRRNLD
jgi:hypothetical protein